MQYHLKGRKKYPHEIKPELAPKIAILTTTKISRSFKSAGEIDFLKTQFKNKIKAIIFCSQNSHLNKRKYLF